MRSRCRNRGETLLSRRELCSPPNACIAIPKQPARFDTGLSSARHDPRAATHYYLTTSLSIRCRISTNMNEGQVSIRLWQFLINVIRTTNQPMARRGCSPIVMKIPWALCTGVAICAYFFLTAEKVHKSNARRHLKSTPFGCVAGSQLWPTATASQSVPGTSRWVSSKRAFPRFCPII